jgi:hypothetical protein
LVIELTACLVTVASVCVLVASNDVPISQWRFAGIKLQPQVWVFAFATIANALLGYAFAEGLVTLFWRQACRGTTVRMTVFICAFFFFRNK